MAWAAALAATVMGLGSACGSGGSSDDSPSSPAASTASASGSTAPTVTATPAPSASATLGSGSAGTPSTGAGSDAGDSTASGPPASWDGSGSHAVYFSATDRVPLGLHEVLLGRAALTRFTARVTATDSHAAAAITTATRSTDFSRSVLVVWTASTGCSQATSAALHVTGNRVQVRVNAPKPPPECLVPNRVTVVFDAPKDKVPAQPQFG